MDGLERRLRGTVSLSLLEVHTEEGRRVREERRVEVLPAFLLTDEDGREVLRREGAPVSAGRVLQALGGDPSR